MKLVKTIFAIICFSSLIIIAQNQHEIIKDESFNIDDFKSSKVMVLGTTDVVNKSLTEAYQSTFDIDSINDFIKSSMVNALQNKMSDITIVEPETNLLENLVNSAQTGKKIDTEADYLVLVNYVFIRDKIIKDRSSGGTTPTAQGGVSRSMVSRNPGILTCTNFEVWNLKEARTVVLAETMGEKRIFQSEETALKDALTKSIDNAADYLKNIESYSRILSRR